MPGSNPGANREITGLLREASGGRREALDEMMPLVYDQLSEMAHARLRRESPGHTLETSALVHEAWLRLIGRHQASWHDRHHFFAVASEAMRRILVDHARQRLAAKRGAGAVHLSIDGEDGPSIAAPAGIDDDAIVALDDALERLAQFNRDGALVVQYRFFAGLGNAEVGEVMGMSERTVRRSWIVARAWLRRELAKAV